MISDLQIVDKININLIMIDFILVWSTEKEKSFRFFCWGRSYD